jgi:hypothetical protein
LALALAIALTAGCSTAAQNKEQYVKPVTYSWENEYRNTEHPAWAYPYPPRLFIMGGPHPYFRGAWLYRPERHRHHRPHRHR